MIAGRSGFANSVQSRLFGRGGVADDASTTFLRVFGENTGRQ